MKQDEIIEMARQAGFKEASFAFQRHKYEAFAKLVDAKATSKERDACAKVCDDWESDEAFVDNIADAIRARGEA